MFVLPLVALLFAVSQGMNAVRLTSLSRFDAFAGKILMGAFFAVPATLMILL